MPLKEPIELELRDGSIVRIMPGPYGKGLSVVPVAPRRASPSPSPRRRVPTGDPRGRKPRPSTVALRQKMAQDKSGDMLGAPLHYVTWLLETDEDLGRPMARTVVYRELKKYR